MATYTVTAWGDLQAAFDAATSPGDIVFLDWATQSATSQVTWTAPAGASLVGRGSLSTPGGGDDTIIVDGFNNSAVLMHFIANASGVLRIAGITFQGHATYSPLKENGMIYFSGGVVRVDHCHIDASMVLPIKPMWFTVKGLMDHCIVECMGNSAIYYGEPSVAAGHAAWAAPTNFGTDEFFYVEDNSFVAAGTDYPIRVGDIFSGGKVVLRFNTIQGGSGIERHATGHSGDDRGARAVESYGNYFSVIEDQGNPPFCVDAPTSGGAMIWGNVSEENNVKTGIFFNVVRKNSTTYPEGAVPDNYGYTGPAPIATGTVDVTGTAVTWVSGDTFDTDWLDGATVTRMINIAGATSVAIPGQEPSAGPGCGIASVNSSTSITLTNGGSSTPLTGAVYHVGSPWDGNTDVWGYPSMDQPGRGQGDLLTGVPPDLVNSETDTISWPNQALEPIYIWNNFVIPNPAYGGVPGQIYTDQSGGLVVANRDYYPQASGIQTNSTTPFDGTVGTGWGTLANRPTTCTTGVGYWAIDQGSWNQSESNPYGVDQEGTSGVLYVATATDTWTEYYVPYTYPHPLQGVSTSESGVSGLVKLSGNCTLK